jgi:signal transduction histidine kinase
MATGETAALGDALSSVEAGPHRLETEVLDRLRFGVVLVDRRREPIYANARARVLLGDDVASPAVREYARRLFAAGVEPAAEVVRVGDQTLSLSGVPAGDAETAVVVVADVTERERRRGAERHFIENAAHELRTPVAAIVSVVEALEAGGKDAPEVRDRFLAHLRTHSARLVQLSTSLLALARVESGIEAPRVELLPLRAFVEDTTVALEPRDGVAIAVDVPETLAVLADPELLGLALSNMASNAVKNTYAGEVGFVGRRVGRSAELELRDTGSGMSASDRDAALARFHRGAGQTGPGFGLGLAIAAGAIEAMGGTLTIETTPDVGTRVRVRLPAAELR